MFLLGRAFTVSELRKKLQSKKYPVDAVDVVVADCKSNFQALSAPILSAIGDRYYKVTAEALRVCGELVRVLRPNLEVNLVFLAMQT